MSTSPSSQSTHQMTLRSTNQDQKIKKNIPKAHVHPASWNPHTHYGQCGQSCPCCRSKVGDIWGSCLVCTH